MGTDLVAGSSEPWYVTRKLGKVIRAMVAGIRGLLAAFLEELLEEHRTATIHLGLPRYRPLSHLLEEPRMPDPFPIIYDMQVVGIPVTAADAAGRAKTVPADLTISTDDTEGRLVAILESDGTVTLRPTGNADHIGTVVNVTISSNALNLSETTPVQIVDSTVASIHLNIAGGSLAPLPG